MNLKSLALALSLFSLPAGAVEPATGGGCSDACSVDDGPAAFSAQAFRDTLAAWVDEPMDAPSLPLETLLFYGHTAADYLGSLDELPLDEARRTFLTRELARTRVQVEMRLVDAGGRELLTRGVPGVSTSYEGLCERLCWWFTLDLCRGYVREDRAAHSKH